MIAAMAKGLAVGALVTIVLVFGFNAKAIHADLYGPACQCQVEE